MSLMQGVSTLLLLAVIAAAGCTGGMPSATPGPSADDLAAIRKMDAQFSEFVLAKDWSNLAKLYADKAVLMPPNARTVMGAPAIAEWFASASGTVHEFKTSVDAIGGSGNLAVNRGSYTLVFSSPGATEAVTEPGKYLWVLQRQPDRTWRITAATWNTDSAK